jgi:hypothetical protein
MVLNASTKVGKSYIFLEDEEEIEFEVRVERQ